MLKRRAVWGILYIVYARVRRSEMGEVRSERIEKIFEILDLPLAGNKTQALR